MGGGTVRNFSLKATADTADAGPVDADDVVEVLEAMPGR
jgi:hypothetical protein